MDLNGKAGANLAKALIITTLAVIVLYLFFWKPEGIKYFPYYHFKPEATFSYNNVPLGEVIPQEDEEPDLRHIFGNSDYDIIESRLTPEECYAKSEGRFVVNGLTFTDMQVSIVEDGFRQIRFTKGFEGLKSYWESKKYFDNICYSIKEEFGNDLNTYQAWKNKTAPKDNSFSVIIKRTRYKAGFYSITLLFSQAAYESEDLYAREHFDIP